jgi:hypothetical protein
VIKSRATNPDGIGQSNESSLYEILKLLDDARLWYRLDRTRPNAILISVTAVAERFEVSVFADGEIELSRDFTGTKTLFLVLKV